MHFALCELDYSNKGKLSSGPAFFSVGEEEVEMATGAEIDPRRSVLP